MTEHKIIPRLTTVVIRRAELEGVIKAVWIEGSVVQYKVSYFANGTHIEAWLIEDELEVPTKLRHHIGF